MFRPELDFVVIDDNQEVVAGASAQDDDQDQPDISAIAPDLLQQGATAEFAISARAKMLIFDPGMLYDLAEMGAEALSGSVETLEPLDTTPADGLLDQLDGEPNTSDQPDEQISDHSEEAEQIETAINPIEELDDETLLPHDLTELIDHLYQADRGLSDSAERLTSIEADEMTDALQDDDDTDDWDEEDAVEPDDMPPPAPVQLWTIRATHALKDKEAGEQSEVSTARAKAGHEQIESETARAAPQSDSVENNDPSSRHNFEELSRVLRERVGDNVEIQQSEPTTHLDEATDASSPMPPASEKEAAAQLAANGMPENATDAPANPQNGTYGPRARKPDLEVASTAAVPSVSGALVA